MSDAQRDISYLEMAYQHHLKHMNLPRPLLEDAVFSKSMSIVYRAATCEDGKKCRGGDHILESLAARAYNLSLSATLLSAAGLYDEALNSIRSLGELSKLLAFLTLYPEEYPNWVRADKKDRLKRFSPAAIREAIEKSSTFMPPMERAVYSELCELSTHVHSGTAPNAFNTDGRRHAGGFHQEVGIDKVAELLSYTLSTIALIIAKMVGRDDLFNQAVADLREK